MTDKEIINKKIKDIIKILNDLLKDINRPALKRNEIIFEGEEE